MANVKQPTDFLKPAATPPIASATGAEAHSMLKEGAVYRGRVTSRNEDGTYVVHLDAPSETIENAVLMSPVLGGALGFTIRARLAPGTRVQLAFGAVPFIFGCIPGDINDATHGRSRSAIWGTVQSDKAQFDDAPTDMVEGEFEIANSFGMMMQFLSAIMRMSAGDRAAVEVHLLNDMVRVISSQYRHISGIGDELIFDHGRPTLERGWSSYRHELMNKMAEAEKFADFSGDKIDPKSITAEKMTAVGRYRLFELVGFAGDFIHSFVTDPPSVAADTLADAAGGSGKSWIHRNSDGSVIVQSVADIRLERVCRIPVPARKASHEDPNITKAREYDKLSADFLKLPDFGSTAKKSAYRMAYHIRSYSRWLSRVHAFARVLQLSAEYSLKSETQVDKPSWTNAEKDKQEAAPEVEYFDSYASISILRDGSIVCHDGYGSSVAMVNGNVQVSASRHLELEAAGDIRMSAGGSVFVKARRNIELSAVLGGMVFHSYAFMRGLCEKGTLWLRSMAPATGTADRKDGSSGDGPTPEIETLNDKNIGVLIEATAGSIVRSGGQLVLAADGSPPAEGDNRTDDSVDIVLQTKGNVRAKCANILAQATRSIIADAGEAMAVNSPCLYGRLAEISFPGALQLNGGTLTIAELRAPTISGNTILGRKLSGFADILDPPTTPIPRHYNHILALPDGTTIALEDGTNAAGQAAADFLNGGMRDSSFVVSLEPGAGPVWNFLDESEYYWDSRDELRGSLTETITQQYIRLDVSGADMWGGNGYDTWIWSAYLPEGDRIGRKDSFGTKSTVYRSDDPDGSDLRSPHDAPTTVPTIDWSSSSSVQLRYLKRQ